MDSEFVNFGEFKGPPVACGTAKAKVEVISNCLKSFSHNSILDIFAKGIDISIDEVLPDCDDITSGMVVVNGKVWFKESEFFDSSACVNNLVGIVLGSSSSGRLWTHWASEDIHKIRTDKDAASKAVNDSVKICL